MTVSSPPFNLLPIELKHKVIDHLHLFDILPLRLSNKLWSEAVDGIVLRTGLTNDSRRSTPRYNVRVFLEELRHQPGAYLALLLDEDERAGQARRRKKHRLSLDALVRSAYLLHTLNLEHQDWMLDTSLFCSILRELKRRRDQDLVLSDGEQWAWLENLADMLRIPRSAITGAISGLSVPRRLVQRTERFLGERHRMISVTWLNMPMREHRNSIVERHGRSTSQ